MFGRRERAVKIDQTTFPLVSRQALGPEAPWWVPGAERGRLSDHQTIFLWLYALAPRRRRGFGHQTIPRICRQQPHRLLDRALELRISPRNHVLRPVLYVDVRGHALIFYRPLVVASEESKP